MLIVHAEEQPLRSGFIAHVRIVVILGGERILLVMVQPVAIRGDARHEDVSRQTVAAGVNGAFHLRCRSAALPVVDIVEYDIEAMAAKCALHRRDIVAVGLQILDALAKIVLTFAMKNRDIVAAFE